MEYRYKVVNPTQNVFLADIPIRMFPGNSYNLDARAGCDARTKSAQLRDAIRMNWVHRVEHVPPKVKKIAVPKPGNELDKISPTDEPTDEEIKAGKVFDTAMDMEVFATTAKGKFSIPSVSGKGKLYFNDRAHAIMRLEDPELLKHLQTLCQG